MKEKFVCAECGAVLTEDEVHEFNGQIMCEDCLDRVTTTCDCCGSRIWRDDDQGNDMYALCNYCYENYYNHCERCGALIHNDDTYYEDDGYDYPYCRDCYEKICDAPIKNYSYKPEPLFYGSGSLFMGVELEVDKGGEYDGNATTIMSAANSNSEHIYCKHDGSISNGFEIVSHPMTLDYHINEMDWLEVFKRAVCMGYRSHQTSTCGLHIHVNRNAFGDTYDKQEEVIARIVHFVELHWNELLKLTRRSIENINRWASRYGIATRAKDTYKNEKDKHLGRYVAVNLENDNTIEFRIFRGTLRYKTFIATLQLVDEICGIAMRQTDEELERDSWSDFVLGIGSDKPELIEYLKSKRLYVNEIQEETEEV